MLRRTARILHTSATQGQCQITPTFPARFPVRTLPHRWACARRAQWPMSQDSPVNMGTVAAVRGSVVDARFEQRLPPLNAVLRAGREAEMVIEVMAQLDAHRVR